MSTAQQHNKISANGATLYDLSVFTDDPFKHGFLAATAAYISNMTQMLADQTNETLSLSQTESEILQTYTTQASKQAELIAQQEDQAQQAQNKASFLGSFVGYLMGALMFIGGLLTADPFMMGMGLATIAMQASGGQQKLENALPSDEGLKALCELGISLGEAALFGGGGLLIENGLSEGGLQAVADAGETSVGKIVGTRLASQTTQALMMNNFWNDLMLKAGLSQDDAAGMSILLGLGSGAVASGFAAKFANEGILLDILKGKMVSKFGDEGLQYYDTFMKGMTVFKNLVQLGSGGMKLSEAEYIKKEADILRNLGKLQKFYTIVQALMQQSSQAITVTQSGQSSVNQSFIAIAQTYPSLGQMWTQPKRA